MYKTWVQREFLCVIFVFFLAVFRLCYRGMCYPVSGMVHLKERVAYVAAAGFLSHYLSGSLPYVWRHITVNKMCIVK